MISNLQTDFSIAWIIGIWMTTNNNLTIFCCPDDRLATTELNADAYTRV